MPLISVVIPVYNGEQTIQETVESVLSQTFQDFELIVINDGSTDSTLDVLSRFSDSRLHVFSYPNAGLPASRNRGIDRASGELIAFIDADDLWTPDKLESHQQILQDNPQVTVVYSWTDYIDEKGQFLHPGLHISVQGNAYPDLLRSNILENGSNPLIRRVAFEAVGTFDESLRAAEDWDMWIRLSEKYPFATVPAPQVLYRVSSTSMSTNVKRQETETLKVIQKAFAQAPAGYQPLKTITLATLHKYLLCKALEGTPHPEKGRQALDQLWKYIQYEPEWRSRSKFILTMLAKSLTTAALLSSAAKMILEKEKI
ncbi:MAG: glycosyltransferase [Microcoleaceae cyanobacterium]